MRTTTTTTQEEEEEEEAKKNLFHSYSSYKHTKYTYESDQIALPLSDVPSK